MRVGRVASQLRRCHAMYRDGPMGPLRRSLLAMAGGVLLLGSGAAWSEESDQVEAALRGVVQALVSHDRAALEEMTDPRAFIGLVADGDTEPLRVDREGLAAEGLAGRIAGLGALEDVRVEVLGELALASWSIGREGAAAVPGYAVLSQQRGLWRANLLALVAESAEAPEAEVPPVSDIVAELVKAGNERDFDRAFARVAEGPVVGLAGGPSGGVYVFSDAKELLTMAQAMAPQGLELDATVERHTATRGAGAALLNLSLSVADQMSFDLRGIVLVVRQGEGWVIPALCVGILGD